MENHKAIYLNNCGISLLRSGTYASAQHSFTEALQCIVRFQAQIKVDGSSRNVEAEEMYKELQLSNLKCRRTKTDKRKVNHSESTNDQEHMNCSNLSLSTSLVSLPLHLQGVVIAQDDFTFFEETEPLSAALGATVLFNLAVTHHVRGLEEESRTKSELRLSCAQNLYVRSQESLSVVVHCEGGINSRQGMSLPLMQYLFLAVPNNYGIIALEKADYDNARQAFECVAYYASIFDSDECDHHFDRSSQISRSRSLFVLNAMCYGNAMQAAAA